MTLCEGALEHVLTLVRNLHDWRCRTEGSPETASIDTGRSTATSEPITLYVRALDDETLLVSDQGETLARLADAGFTLDDPIHAALWDEALYTYRVSPLDDRVFLQTSLREAAANLVRLADALVALDALRLVALPAPGRTRGLADEVEGYLRRHFAEDRVERQPQVRLRNGLRIQPALRVHTDVRPVLVQPGASGSRTQAYDHAHTLFSLARRGGVPREECLVVLGGEVRTWNAARLRVLSEEAFVGFWRYRSPIDDFLAGVLPDDPLMVPPGVDVPLIPG